MALHQEPVPLPLDRLKPDRRNPRLPEPWEGDDIGLYSYIARNYDALTVARSIAEFGFFSSEPLVVMSDGDDWTVLEGNRRLTALKGLADADVRAGFDERDTWDALAASADIPVEIQCVVADEWTDAAPLIGYRHVSGIQEWKSFPKARFIDELVDRGYPFGEIGVLVGEPESTVRALYRNLAMLRQASEQFGIQTGDAEAKFGIFTAAMNRRALRLFVEAPQPGEVQPADPPLPEGAEEPLELLLSWIYGDEEHDPVIDESRDLAALARIVGSVEAVEELRETRSLELADAAAGGPQQRLLGQAQRAANTLEAVERALNRADPDDLDPLEAALMRCEEAIGRIRVELLDIAARAD